MRATLLIPAAALFTAALSGAHAQEKTAWDGVYSTAQAERGDKRYADACAPCHGADMAGGPGIPGLTGIEFMFKYNNKPVAELFDYMKANMPPGQSGSLTDPQYADVVAAVLKGNGFPEGPTELASSAEALKGIFITRVKP
jgi:mono/diheme cytochrome c family protein